MNLTIYGKTQCSYCEKAKALLNSKGIEYTYIDLMEYTEALAFIRGTGARTVPQIFNGDTLIGGFDQLVEWLLEKEL